MASSDEWSEGEDVSGPESDEGALSDTELRRRHMAGTLGQMRKTSIPVVETRTRGALHLEALAAKRKEIGISEGLEWTETLMLTTPTLDAELDVNNDFAREAAFYDRTLQAVVIGEGRLKASGIPYLRPLDYYAEMIKTDDHMKRIKQQLLTEKTQIEASEQARKQRMAKKFGKKVQQDVLEKRQKAKRATLEQVARHRKGLQARADGPAGGDDDGFNVAVDHDDADKGAKQQHGAKQGGSGGGVGGGVNHRRMAKNHKFGTGGHKGSRRNDSSSAAETGDFSMARNRRPFHVGRAARTTGGGHNGGAAGKKAGGRPGKSARQKQHSRR